MRKGLAVLGVGLLALSGCSGRAEIPEPQPAASLERAALSESHFAEVSESIYATLAQADQNLDGQLLATRAYDPFYAERASRYNLKNILKDSYTVPAVPTQPQGDNSVAVSKAQGFPRYAVVAMQPAADSALPAVPVFSQPSARQNWGIWSSMAIMPGATLPSIAGGSQGAELIAADDSAGLVISPQQAIASYAQYLTNDDSQGLTFAASAEDPSKPDPFHAGVDSEIAALKAAFEGSGEAAYSFSPTDIAPVAMRDADGGAFVAVPLNYTMTIRVTAEGAKITLEDQRITAVATGQPGQSIGVDGEMRVTFNVQLAFRIPPAGAEPVITVIAASQPVVTKVENGAPAPDAGEEPAADAG